MSSEQDSYLLDATSPDNNWLTVFEDDGETGYLYFCAFDLSSGESQIIDHLWVYDQISPTIYECEKVNIFWSDDSSKVCLIVDGECWGMIDIKNKRKLSAPREGISIKTIDRSTWDNGLEQNEGEVLRVKR
ncbi:DUF2251 domain-containing protein [Paenibacillus sp. DLE-14]|uniref:DUF2251 domain-containing protein n=1 Tax=Paenibacillus lignilyticus TaxID=1172615 RepID=A0ABS5CKZ8_9BACL|nr:DUF2251 domain-containing protein [Paenibacillus lignilyticus]